MRFWKVWDYFRPYGCCSRGCGLASVVILVWKLGLVEFVLEMLLLGKFVLNWTYMINSQILFQLVVSEGQQGLTSEEKWRFPLAENDKKVRVPQANITNIILIKSPLPKHWISQVKWILHKSLTTHCSSLVWSIKCNTKNWLNWPISGRNKVKFSDTLNRHFPPENIVKYLKCPLVCAYVRSIGWEQCVHLCNTLFTCVRLRTS